MAFFFSTNKFQVCDRSPASHFVLLNEDSNYLHKTEYLDTSILLLSLVLLLLFLFLALVACGGRLLLLIEVGSALDQRDVDLLR